MNEISINQINYFIIINNINYFYYFYIINFIYLIIIYLQKIIHFFFYYITHSYLVGNSILKNFVELYLNQLFLISSLFTPLNTNNNEDMNQTELQLKHKLMQ
jgi:hypothetical protein